jgi:mRNA interferase RelE/StbE
MSLLTKPIWDVVLTKQALKDLKKMDPPLRTRILDYLMDHVAICEDPKRIGKVLGATKRGLLRFRVAGDYRAVCEIHDNKMLILVLEMGHRREIYRH